ncbi:hypothetical protein ABL78_5902 [Leptomonas seymouri]|uniref:Uncharacterized protein n=1 Tax=Leptomonas seymouri TaxID=5684 RepID=A0A0N1IIT3_LEPSE|nr:hypothetical protein ABL78_5902 [Leptomonas seymouri]|eukprot:KPI85040.1 hypothetical protein ABL78_5902 [Leptomonas seymouri]
MQRWSQASTAMSSGPAFDIDLPEPAAAAEPMRIFFCGRPARSTGVVNLRLLLGEHGYVLTEKRRVKGTEHSSGAIDHRSNKEERLKRSVAGREGDTSSATEDGESSTNVSHDKAPSQTTYRMCSSEGLPPGCFRVKHDGHYWVMRAGDGARPEQTPSPRTTETETPSPSALSDAPSRDRVDPCSRDHSKSKDTRKADLSEQKRGGDDEKSKRKRPRHTADAGKAESVTMKAVRLDHNSDNGKSGDDEGDSLLATRYQAGKAAERAPTEPADTTEDIVRDVEATLGELFFAASPLASSNPSLPELHAQAAKASVPRSAPGASRSFDNALKNPDEVQKTNNGVTHETAERDEAEGGEMAEAAPHNPQRRGRRGAAAAAKKHTETKAPAVTAAEAPTAQSSAVDPSSARVVGEKTASPTEKRRGKQAKKEKSAMEVAALEEPTQQPQPEPAAIATATAAAALPNRQTETTPPPSNAALQSNVRNCTSVCSPPAPPSSSPSLPPHPDTAAAARRTPTQSPPIARSPDVLQKQPAAPTARDDMRSPAIRPPLSPHVALPPKSGLPATDHRSGTGATPLRSPHRSSPGGADTGSPLALYSNRTSGTGASPPPQQQHPSSSSPLAPAPAVRSASSSTRLAPLTSPHLRQHQQQFVHRGSSSANNGNTTGHGGSLQYSDTGSFNMIPQDSPALGFTQVHNTLAEEFSLDPSESGSSATVSEYLYDVDS